MKASLLFLLLLLACSAAPREERTPVAEGGDRPGGAHGAGPPEALELLRKSASDSCAVCAREAREKAFDILAEQFPPGRVVESDSTGPFRIVPGGENELFFPSFPASVVFRFHTVEARLVGIAETDWTSPSVAGRLYAAPPDRPLHGSIEIIPFAYGDGPTFSYSPPRNTLQVHCRVVEIGEE